MTKHLPHQKMSSINSGQMKKYFTLFGLLLIMLPLFSLGQTEKGKFIIYAGTDLTAAFGKNTVKYDGNDLKSIKTTAIEFEPAFGYFVADNLSVGISLPLSFQKNGYDLYEIKESVYGASLFGRYYLGENQWKPFVGAEVGYLASKSYSEVTGSEMDDLFGGLAYAASIGMSSFINQHVSFDFSVGYAHANMGYSQDRELKMAISGIGIEVGLSIIPGK
jgi:outer membrane protein W